MCWLFLNHEMTYSVLLQQYPNHNGLTKSTLISCSFNTCPRILQLPLCRHQESLYGRLRKRLGLAPDCPHPSVPGGSGSPALRSGLLKRPLTCRPSTQPTASQLPSCPSHQLAGHRLFKFELANTF